MGKWISDPIGPEPAEQNVSFNSEVDIKEESNSFETRQDGDEVKGEEEDGGPGGSDCIQIECETVLKFEKEEPSQDTLESEDGKSSPDGTVTWEPDTVVTLKWSADSWGPSGTGRGPPLKCRLCHVTLTSESELVDHVNSHKSCSYRCTDCDRWFDRLTSLRIHQSVHGNRKRRHECSVCGKSYTRKSSLADHMLSHSGEKPYQCDVCKKHYRSKVSLASHARYHFKAKDYACPVCDRSFLQPSGLTEHLVIHRHVKDFRCGTCGKCYAYRSSLLRHVQSHTGQVRHVCDECGKCFSQASSLSTHKRIIHLGLRPFRCEDCNKRFARPRALRLHMNSHRVLQIQKTICVVSGLNNEQ